MAWSETGAEQPYHKDGETSRVLTDTKMLFQGQTGLALCELAAWLISLWQWAPSQKVKLPIKKKNPRKKRPFHSHSSKVTFPAVANVHRSNKACRQPEMVAGCRSADPRAKIWWLEGK